MAKTLKTLVAELQLALDEASDKLKKTAAEKDELTTKIVSLTQRVSQLLKDKAQLESDLNDLRLKLKK